MVDKKQSKNGSWWNHETDPSQLAGLSTAFNALQKDQHASGWRRNVTVVLCLVALLTAVKLLLS